MRCPNCGGYSFDDYGACTNCKSAPPGKSNFLIGKVDTFAPAEGLAKKEGRLLFFSHPSSMYYTPAEEKCLELLEDKFPDHYLLNPRDIVMKMINSNSNTNDKLEYTLTLMEAESHLIHKVRECNILAYYEGEEPSSLVEDHIVEADKRNIPIFQIEI
jgi:hypothetical protein